MTEDRNEVWLSDGERRVIVDALHMVAIMVRPPAGSSIEPVTREIWLGVARKLEGTDKQVIVRTRR